MRIACGIFALALSVLPVAAQAKGGGAALAEAKRMMRVPKYADAIRALERALADPELSRDQRIEALEILGSAHIARNDASRADEAFSRLLELAPDHELAPSLSPKIRAVFDRVKERRTEVPRVETVTATLAGERIAFSVRVHDPDSRVEAVVLHCRSDEGEFAEKRMTPGDGVHTATVAVEPKTTRVEYFVVVRDRSGGAIEVGSAKSPSTIFLERAEPERPKLEIPPAIEAAPEEPSIVSRWWFWTIVVAVAVAGGVGIYFLARPGEPEVMGNLTPPIDL